MTSVKPRGGICNTESVKMMSILKIQLKHTIKNYLLCRTKTVCEQTSQTLSREVCHFEYDQKFVSFSKIAFSTQFLP